MYCSVEINDWWILRDEHLKQTRKQANKTKQLSFKIQSVNRIEKKVFHHFFFLVQVFRFSRSVPIQCLSGSISSALSPYFIFCSKNLPIFYFYYYFIYFSFIFFLGPFIPSYIWVIIPFWFFKMMLLRWSPLTNICL